MAEVSGGRGGGGEERKEGRRGRKGEEYREGDTCSFIYSVLDLAKKLRETYPE